MNKVINNIVDMESNLSCDKCHKKIEKTLYIIFTTEKNKLLNLCKKCYDEHKKNLNKKKK